MTDIILAPVFLPAVSDSLAAGGRDRVGSASLVDHQLVHAAESHAAHSELQRATALPLRRRSTAVCVRARAVDGEVQRGKNCHTASLFGQEECSLVSAVVASFYCMCKYFYICLGTVLTVVPVAEN